MTRLGPWTDTIGEHDTVALTDGRTVTISRVVTPGKTFTYWDERFHNEYDWELPLEREVSTRDIDHIVLSASAPVLTSPDGWDWAVSDFASEGRATLATREGSRRVNARLFREAVACAPDLFERLSSRERALRNFLARNPSYDAESVARKQVEYWERLDVSYEVRDNSYLHDVPGVSEWIQAIDTPERRHLLEERRALDPQVGDVVTDDAGRRLLVVGASGRSCSVIEVDDHNRAVGKLCDPVNRIDVASIVVRHAMSYLDTKNLIAMHTLAELGMSATDYKKAKRDSGRTNDGQQACEDLTPTQPDTVSRADEAPVDKSETPNWVWCLVANVRSDTPIGQGWAKGKGTRMFAAGTKLYVYPLQFSSDESLVVLGSPRNHRAGLRQVIISRKRLTNFRLKRLFNPIVVQAMTQSEWPPGSGPDSSYYDGWDASDESRERIECLITWFSLTPEEERRRDLVCSCERLRLTCWLEDDPDSLGEFTLEIIDDEGAPMFWRASAPRSGIWKPLGGTSHLLSFHPQQLVDTKVFLWDPRYEAEAVEGHGYGWRLEVRCREEYLVYSGRNVVPEGFEVLCHLLEATGLPIAFDEVMQAPRTCAADDADVAFARAMDAFEGNEDVAMYMVRALATSGGDSVPALLKLLRMDEDGSACALFSPTERDCIVRAWQAL